MTETSIQRIVHGEVTDPNSTRDLIDVSQLELEHLKLCLISAIREAQAFQMMGDEEMVSLVANVNVLNEQHLLPTLDLSQSSPEALREYFTGREQNQAKLLDKLRQLEEAPIVTILGITPEEYMHLVTSVQSGLREAMIYAPYDQQQIQRGFDTVKGLFVGWGLDAWDHYDQWSDGWPEFFVERETVLNTVLEVINQPYPGFKKVRILD